MNAPTLIPGIATDGSLFPIEKMAAHKGAIFHLAISVFLFDGPRLLIQRRAAHKYHCGSQWANTCCSHPHWQESLSDCAHRRLREELGVRVPLTASCTVEYEADVGQGLTEHERVTFFLADVRPQTLRMRLNPDEVSEVRWVAPAALRGEIAEAPERFTPWFRIYVERFPDLRF
ncbi:MAG: isopentenyl-diphosphate delta-isomerase [Pseudomonadota bacterium]